MTNLYKSICFFTLLVITLIFSSCEDNNTTGPFLKNGLVAIDSSKWQIDASSNSWIVSTGINQKVLLTEYTGFKCGNCPAAHEISEQIKENNNGNIILMTIHSGPYAKPDTKHLLDLRSTEGDNIGKLYNESAFGNPDAEMNRIKQTDGSTLLRSTAWPSAATNALNNTPNCGITLKTQYIDSSKTINLTAGVYSLSDLDSNQRFTVYLVEDSVVGYQLDERKTPADLPNFVHQNVFRGSFFGIYGEQILIEGSTSTIKKGTKFFKKFSYQIPNGKDWNPKHLRIVAFIADKSNTYRIGQVSEIKLFP